MRREGHAHKNLACCIFYYRLERELELSTVGYLERELHTRVPDWKESYILDLVISFRFIKRVRF